ncbi:hypothetical protein [Legionella tunisiensis]|uniref:hypothetical protein n=1 Tax=Legionella tunisiensis TaxID=1034944 RepID=UPI0002FDEADC|nr:hypothetical protein [Legionella tunisiensis]
MGLEQDHPKQHSPQISRSQVKLQYYTTLFITEKLAELAGVLKMGCFKALPRLK